MLMQTLTRAQPFLLQFVSDRGKFMTDDDDTICIEIPVLEIAVEICGGSISIRGNILP
jgi:hypothetical protein